MTTTNGTANGTTPPTPANNVILTLPRTASNLLTQVLNFPAQPNIVAHPRSGYFFIDTFFQRFLGGLVGYLPSEWDPEKKEKVRETGTAAFEKWIQWMDDGTAEGKGTFMKEHIPWLGQPDYEKLIRDLKSVNEVYSKPTPTKSWVLPYNNGSDTTISTNNVTVLPDTFWLTKVRPTFLIRHPAITFFSLLRAAKDAKKEQPQFDIWGIMETEGTYFWHHTMYEFFSTSPSFNRASHDPAVSYPIILDAEDMVNRPLMERYARATGLDPAHIQYEWEPQELKESGDLLPLEARFKDTLLASRGLDESKLRKAKDIVIEEEKKKWVDVFGEEEASKLEALVRDAMPDYEWLRERRLTV